LLSRDDVGRGEVAVLSLYFADARLWRYVLRGLSEFLDVVGIRLHPEEGLRIKAMDPSHVILVDFSIPKTAFDSYNVKKEELITINLELAAKVLRRATRNDKLYLESDGTRLTLGLVSKGGVERYFIMPLLSQKFEEIPELSLELNSYAKIVGPVFATAISILAKAGETLRITADKESIRLASVSDLGEVEFEFSTATGTLVDYQPPDEEIVNNYSLEYIELLGNIAKLADMVTVKLGPEMPIEIDMELSSGAQLKAYVAPRVE